MKLDNESLKILSKAGKAGSTAGKNLANAMTIYKPRSGGIEISLNSPGGYVSGIFLTANEQLQNSYEKWVMKSEFIKIKPTCLGFTAYIRNHIEKINKSTPETHSEYGVTLNQLFMGVTRDE